MASVNIDAAIVSRAEILQRDEQMIQMQNGCICCTLRKDLLEEVHKLAEQGKFDVLIIESTGISEPMQVAETFAMTSEDLSAGGSELKSLSGVARLDCCVTVMDVTTMFSFFENTNLVVEEFPDTSEDANPERNVVDLLVDQIEFANVIVLNKTEMVSSKVVEKAEQLVKSLNPSAKIIRTSFSDVPLEAIINTGLFDMDKAALLPGWLQSLNEETPHKPETLEYGIGSFIYRARRPFHPKRLFELLEAYFLIIEDIPEIEDHDGGENVDEDNEEFSGNSSDADDDEDMKDEDEAIAERVEARRTSPFKDLFRSKGFFWLLNRDESMGEWAQAGAILTVKEAGGWFACVEESEWPEHLSQEEKLRIRKDFDLTNPEIGDRRQEIVFIGHFSENADKKLINLLDECLVTEEEWTAWKNGTMSASELEDPWTQWETYDDLAACDLQDQDDR